MTSVVANSSQATPDGAGRSSLKRKLSIESTAVPPRSSEVIDDDRYRIEVIPLPPPPAPVLKDAFAVMRAAAQKEKKKKPDRFTLFFTSKFVFSNHRRCRQLLIGGLRFSCTEQYYMWCKAMTFGDTKTAECILKTDDPKAMKRLGSSVKGFQQAKWDAPGRAAMVIANTHKYTQNEDMRRELFLTHGTELVECNPGDCRWGIGLSMQDPRAHDRSRWRGTNWLGQILTKIRRKLWRMDKYADEVERVRRTLKGTRHARGH